MYAGRGPHSKAVRAGAQLMVWTGRADSSLNITRRKALPAPSSYASRADLSRRGVADLQQRSTNLSRPPQVALSCT
jgi:hypothetical protein